MNEFDITIESNDPYEQKCRICFSNNKNERLISPCHCKGSIGALHKSCLEYWLETQHKDSCELCTMVYPVVRIPKGFRDYIASPENAKARSYLLSEFFIIIMLTPVVIFSAVLCISEAVSNFSTFSNVISGVSFMLLAGIVISAFILYVAATLRYHYKKFIEWKEINWKVYLIEDVLIPDETIEGENELSPKQMDDSQFPEQSTNIITNIFPQMLLSDSPLNSNDNIIRETTSSVKQDTE